MVFICRLFRSPLAIPIPKLTYPTPNGISKHKLTLQPEPPCHLPRSDTHGNYCLNTTSTSQNSLHSSLAVPTTLSAASRHSSSAQFLPTLASPNRQQLSSQNPNFEQPHSHQSSNVGFLPLSLIWSIPHCTINTLQSASHQSLWVRSQSWAATDGQCFKNKSFPSVTMVLKWQWCSVGCRKVRR